MTLSITNAFSLCPTRIRVPENLVESYKAATNWATFADRIMPLEEWIGSVEPSNATDNDLWVGGE